MVAIKRQLHFINIARIGQIVRYFAPNMNSPRNHCSPVHTSATFRFNVRVIDSWSYLRNLYQWLLLTLAALFLATAAHSSIISASSAHGNSASSSCIDSNLSATSYQKVTEVYNTPERVRTLVHLTLDNGQTLTATDGHPFKTDEGWRDAVLLKKGGKLLLKDSDADAAQPRYTTIADVRIEQERITTYNLEVAQLHTYFVGVDGVVVHNATRGPKPIGTGPHNLRIEEIAQEIIDGGGSIISGGQRKGPGKETLIPCKGGKKAGRRPDIIARDANGNRFGVNVGRTDAKGRAIPREQAALDDLNDFGNLPTTYRGYD